MNDIVILRSAIIIPRVAVADMDLQVFEDALSAFKLRFKAHMGSTKELVLYKCSAAFYLFPKASVKMLIKSGIVGAGASTRFSTMAPAAVNIKLRVLAKELTLFPNQELIVKHLMQNVYSDACMFNRIAGCVLVAPPGDGKTRIALATAAQRGYNTLFIVANKLLMKQAEDEIRAMFGNAVKITFAGGNRKPDNTGDFVIGIINTVVKQKADFFEPFGFTIIDEAHDYCSADYSNVFWRAQSVCTLAMTASPDERKDKFDRALTIHVGPYVYATDLPGYSSDEVKFACSVMLMKYNGPPEYTRALMNEKMRTMSSDLMIKQLHRDPYRLAMVANMIARLYEGGRNTYVFVEQKVYGYLLRDAINKGKGGDVSIVDNKDDFHIIIGGSSDDDISRAKSGGKGCVIITTYGYSRKGVSIQKMDTIVFATPRRTGMTQICGRIFRRGGDADVVRLIVDVVDNACRLRDRAVDRRKHYCARGYDIKEDTINYSQLTPMHIEARADCDDGGDLEMPDGLDD